MLVLVLLVMPLQLLVLGPPTADSAGNYDDAGTGAYGNNYARLNEAGNYDAWNAYALIPSGLILLISSGRLIWLLG